MRKVTLSGRDGVFELVCRSTKTSRVRPNVPIDPTIPASKSAVTPDSFLVPTGEILLDLTGQEMVQAVKDHAVDQYENGWDVVVETCTDAELTALIGSATDPKVAIRKVAWEFNLEPKKVSPESSPVS